MSAFTCRDTFLPFSPPDISPAELDNIAEVIRSGWWARGPKTIAFEKAFADYVGVKHAIGMNSCTAALHVALLCAGVGPGDEVITTPYTFAASANTVLHVGATPVFVDIDPDTGCIDVDKIEAAITPRTKAIVPVHYSGMACDLGRIYEIADQHGLFVSEDAAHAVETRYNGQLIGHHPRNVASFSFYVTKNLATGEGGMLVTDDDAIAARARVLTCHGMSASAWNRYGKGGQWRYDIEEPGFKYNMFDIQAALGLAQLPRMADMQARRFEAVRIYDTAFSQMSEVTLQKNPAYSTHSKHLYVLRLTPGTLAIDRDQFIVELGERNIGTSVHFIPVHLMSAYTKRFGYKPGDLPCAEAFFEQEISLPLNSSLKPEDAQYVVAAVQDIVEKFRA